MTYRDTHRFIIPLVSFNNIEFVREICDYYASKDISYLILAKNEYVREEALRVFSPQEVLKSAIDHTPNEPLDNLVDKYNIKSSRNLVFPDMVYDYDYVSPNYTHHFPNREIPYEEYIKRLHKWLDMLDSLYADEGYIPIQNQGGEIFRQCLYRVAEHHGYPVVWRGSSPIPERCSLHFNDELSWQSLNETIYEALSEKERSDAKELVEVITGKKERIGSTSKSIRERIKQKLQAVRAHRSDLVEPTISWLRRSLISDVKEKYFTHVYLNEQESRNFIEQNQFVYYPLQYFRESRVTYRSNAYYNQLWLAEYLARSLPHGYELIIKDHPRRIGELPLSFPRKLSRVACAINHNLNSREIIEAADAVVTLNNTVGFESLMYGKPVVALGSGFYADSKYVNQVNNINDLEENLYEAVNSNGLSEEEVTEVAAGIVSGSYPGVWGDKSKENVKQFGDSVLRFIDEGGE
jgi:hypothetical protein